MSENDSSNKSNSSSGCGCFGCISVVMFILMVTAMGWGLSIGKHKWNIDIFPPRIWDMNDKVETVEETVEEKEIKIKKEN